ncbi:unnamed protein product [Leptidea sinapis]|uniref:Ig-like domain-containing protein n=1 Tax=Leptidea sinapis TaxID=189913 RepID=A0A5E4QIQ2_9NEOP|nr:unnamed protein product [Leptidea sinapis]
MYTYNRFELRISMDDEVDVGGEDEEPSIKFYGIIKDIQETDAGWYQCQVIISISSKITAEVELQVRRPPIISDNSTRISHFATADEFTDTTLRVITIEKRQYGIFTCKAQNKLGRDEGKVELFVFRCRLLQNTLNTFFYISDLNESPVPDINYPGLRLDPLVYPNKVTHDPKPRLTILIQLVLIVIAFGVI